MADVQNNNIYVTLYSLLMSHKWEKFISMVIEKKDQIDVNVRDSKNNYMMTYAVMMNRHDVAQALIDQGAKVDIVDDENRSVSYYAITLQYDKILDILLKANEVAIGVSMLHRKDDRGKTPLGYAIESKNKYAIRKILEYKGNPNIRDDEGYNSLHNAVHTRDLEIVDLISHHVSDINSRCSTGETALHIAANFQLEEICELLLDKESDPNIQDFSYEFTPLHYAVTLGDQRLTQILLKYGANPNVQDIYGNTSLHYGISEGSYSCVIEIINFKYKESIVLNFNLWNIKSMLPAQMFFADFSDDKIYYLDKFIDKTSMSFRDNTGNSLLHYLAINNIWKNYKKEIANKKLDIYSKNIHGKSVVDYIDKNDMDEFLDLVTVSYLNRLKRNSGKWMDSFDQVCSLDFDKLSKDERKKLKVSNEKDFEENCRKIVKSKIIKLNKEVHEGKKICSVVSHGSKKNSCMIEVEVGVPVNFCTYTGSTLDVLIGLIYLLKKHKFACSTLSKNFVNNNDLCQFYKSMGIVMNNRCEFLNFEIVWIHYKLYIMEAFYDIFKKCLNKGKRFVVIPLGIEMKNGNHANYIIYDKVLNEVERFEPHGTTSPIGLNYRPSLLDDVLEKRFNTFNMKIKYIRPSNYLPKIGFQLFDSNERNKKRIGDPGGFCALWSLWYTDMRLTYPEMDRRKLVKSLIKNIKNNHRSFKDVIRNYSKNIISIRDELLQSAKMDVNDWMNDNYTEDQLTNFMENVGSMLGEVVV